MITTIRRSATGGSIEAISSKSMAHRLLIAAALSGGGCEVRYGRGSADIDATGHCLDALMSAGDAGCAVPVRLPCGESGSTLRFMLPVAGALGIKSDLIMEGRLPDRPIAPLDRELEAHGCIISRPEHDTIRIEGRLSGGEYTLPGDVSSQYVTGLLLALPLIDEESVLNIEGRLQSEPYVEMTLSVLKRAGIDIVRTDRGYKIPAGQSYDLQGIVDVEGDWSNAAFWLCLGAISERSVICSGLNTDSTQGDREVVSILERMGAQIDIERSDASGRDKITVSGGVLQGTVIDASDIPDLVPVLAVVSAAASGTTRIVNAGRLRLKESDRLSAVCTVLGGLGADISETDDGLVINGTGRMRGGRVDSFNDHRIAMMAAVAASICDEAVTIERSEAVGKSYPDFFRDYIALGGITEES